MASGFVKPDPKKQLSARVRGSSLAKAKVVAQVWAERLRAQGEDEAAEEIDVTYVVDLLLAKVLDDELAQWGGYPDDADKLEALLKTIRKTSKQ